MAKQTNDYKPTGFRIEAVKFGNADGTTTKAVCAADVDDSVIIQVTVSSLSPSDETLRLYLYDGVDDFFLADILVPALSGVGANPVIDVLDAIPGIYNASLPLEATWSLRAAATSEISVAGDITLSVIITDY